MLKTVSTMLLSRLQVSCCILLAWQVLFRGPILMTPPLKCVILAKDAVIRKKTPAFKVIYLQICCTSSLIWSQQGNQASLKEEAGVFLLEKICHCRAGESVIRSRTKGVGIEPELHMWEKKWCCCQLMVTFLCVYVLLCRCWWFINHCHSDCRTKGDQWLPPSALPSERNYLSGCRPDRFWSGPDSCGWRSPSTCRTLHLWHTWWPVDQLDHCSSQR